MVASSLYAGMITDTPGVNRPPRASCLPPSSIRLVCRTFAGQASRISVR